jgi:carboxylesterase type B
VLPWAAKSGYVGVNVTYRLAPANAWPAAQQDLGAALAWVRAHVATRGGDPARVFLVGHSAGGAHVAQYLGHPRGGSTAIVCRRVDGWSGGPVIGASCPTPSRCLQPADFFTSANTKSMKLRARLEGTREWG